MVNILREYQPACPFLFTAIAALTTLSMSGCVDFQCEKNSDCRLGERCSEDHICIYGCDTDEDCSAEYICVDHECVDHLLDKITVNIRMFGSYVTQGGEQCWSRHSSLVLIFDSPREVAMDRSSVHDALTISPIGNIQFEWSDYDWLSVHPPPVDSASIDYDWESTHYDVFLESSAHNIDGNVIDRDYEFSFCILLP